ncbi:hypothetical protein TRVA0_019S01288 [Trichomonascus vanleenenianus]|uniref:uncharacterized protein n=1 Tax=Trichomonascus vanleenenianus TaxID=2268995 RepID=UPI003ECA3E1A
MNQCALCGEPIDLFANDGEALTDVEFPCGDHFHWECVIAHSKEPSRCPHCDKAVINGSGQLLVTLASYDEDEPDNIGVDRDYDILPVIVEEQEETKNPRLRLHRHFLDACFVGDQETVFLALSQDPEIVNTAVDPDKKWTGLFFASVAGHSDIVTYLLAHGADTHTVDAMNHRPIDYAIEERHDVVVCLLSSAGRA